MDLRGYYRRIRDLESTIEAKDVVVVSLSTPDGGAEGIVTEVPKRVGCQLTVEGKARLASAAEAESFRKSQIEAQRAAEHSSNRQLQIGLLSDSDLRSIKAALHGNRGPDAEVS
jgi:hypothetical protein